jgi:hypothetical protein
LAKKNPPKKQKTLKLKSCPQWPGGTKKNFSAMAY